MAQYPVGPQVTLVFSGQGPVTLVSQDASNSVTIGGRSTVTVDDMSGHQLLPMSSVTYGPGYHRLYAIAPAGTAALMVIRGAVAWNQP